jgi:hypothetical protein
MGIGGSFDGVKRPGRQTNYSPLPTAEVKNGGAIYSLPHTYSWRVAYLIRHRDNFTFYILLLLSGVCDYLEGGGSGRSSGGRE